MATAVAAAAAAAQAAAIECRPKADAIRVCTRALCNNLFSTTDMHTETPSQVNTLVENQIQCNHAALENSCGSCGGGHYRAKCPLVPRNEYGIATGRKCAICAQAHDTAYCAFRICARCGEYADKCDVAQRKRLTASPPCIAISVCQG